MAQKTKLQFLSKLQLRYQTKAPLGGQELSGVNDVSTAFLLPAFVRAVGSCECVSVFWVDVCVFRVITLVKVASANWTVNVRGVRATYHNVPQVVCLCYLRAQNHSVLQMLVFHDVSLMLELEEEESGDFFCLSGLMFIKLHTRFKCGCEFAGLFLYWSSGARWGW